MQFKTLLVLSALALAVAAPDYGSKNYSSGYDKSTSSEGYDKSSTSYGSSSGGYSNGYAKPHFPAPSFGARMRARFHKLGHALHHLLGEFVGFFHTHWVNFKSDLERIHWWLHCRREHFHIWWKWKCEVAANKRKIRNQFEQQIYDSLCAMEKTEKSKYDERVRECQGSGTDYTEEEISNYVDAAYQGSQEKYEPKPAYEEPKPSYDKPAYEAPKTY